MKRTYVNERRLAKLAEDLSSLCVDAVEMESCDRCGRDAWEDDGCSGPQILCERCGGAAVPALDDLLHLMKEGYGATEADDPELFVAFAELRRILVEYEEDQESPDPVGAKRRSGAVE